MRSPSFRLSLRPSVAAHLTGALAARTGDEAAGPALALAGFAAAGSTSGAAALLACVTVAAAVGGPAFGALLDRSRRPGRLLSGALALYAAGLGAVLLGLGRLPFAVTALLAVVTGLTGPALSGGWTAQLPGLAPAGRMPRLHGLDSLTFSVAALAGPALAGGAALLLGAPAAVVVAAALVAAAVPVAWALPPADPRPGGRARGGRVRAVFGRGPLLRATVTSVGCAAAQGVVAACLPALGARTLGAPGQGALLLSVAAAASLAATALHARLRRTVAAARVLWGAALAQAGAWTVAATGGAGALVVAFAVAGAAEGPQLTALFAVRHEETPGWLRGRVFTTGAGLKITGFAVGAAAAGPVAARSVAAALLLAAVLCACSALPYAGLRNRRTVRATPWEHRAVRGTPGARRSVRRRGVLRRSSGRP
ncbi:MFS transporter [Streptomyces sp. R302]|uniref:MFS transporter n=1 Tax=unclassified Streptomyces TaxID=2593676 RepID=UPI00145EBE79|nr:MULTISPECIES: MFS transporter [unclassified Streptomyces]NML55222.1 MFS transporter [Streptomyces sp. R301]NML82642.1 MFS transporter [Streptomyces sp. R302]